MKTIRRSAVVLILAILQYLLITGASLCQTATTEDSLRKEETHDYYGRWLAEDVAYIITDEERAVFRGLVTEEEKERFVEQFWFRRDPDPQTSNNEFKEEHYRRIAFANERFTSGLPGWMTDRGRIYIIHGPPDSIETRPMGGHYERTIEEGGGVTSVHPFEKWTYREIRGLGQNIELEFVDKTGTAEYELVVFDWEKDALLQMPTAETEAEMAGLTTRADHPAITPASAGLRNGPLNWYRRADDTPFRRYELDALIASPPPIKYKDLQEQVDVSIEYSSLPFSLTEHYIKLNEGQALVLITIQLAHRALTFDSGDQQRVARLALYGIVQSLGNRLETEFEDEVVIRLAADELKGRLKDSSLYQKILALDQGKRYKLDLVLKDLTSGQVGVVTHALTPPSFGGTELKAGSVILSDAISMVGEPESSTNMFVLGDVRIVPNLDRRFSPEDRLGVYFQVYNAGIDQNTLRPSMKVNYAVLRDGELRGAVADPNGSSIQYFSSRRVVMLTELELQTLVPGEYELKIEVIDEIKKRSLTVVDHFTVYDRDGIELHRPVG